MVHIALGVRIHRSTTSSIKESAVADEAETPICGMVMPISAIDTCSEEHWRDVKEILTEAIQDAGFTPQLVSDADDVGIIQKRIIQNLYENPVVVCDVSAKNPNVMFELGMRLAFDRPTIIVKDDKTTYSFDTSPIEHLPYPRDLRFSKIVEFKEALSEKIKATHLKATKDKTYTTFLKHFGTFKVAELKTEIVPQDRLLLEEMKSLRELVLATHASAVRAADRDSPAMNARLLCVRDATPDQLKSVYDELRSGGFEVRRSTGGPEGHTHLRFSSASPDERRAIMSLARKHAPDARWLNVPRATDA